MKLRALYPITVFVVVLVTSAFSQALLPVIRIETENGAEINSRTIYTNITSFAFVDPNNPLFNFTRSGLKERDQIRGRGNTTWYYSKKPYRIKFRDNVPLLGRAAHKNWILLAEFRDPTFLANAVTFKLGRDIFEYQPYTNTYQHVHVYLNGRYDGVYGLTEHRQASPNGIGAPGRVGIDPEEGWLTEFIHSGYYGAETDPKFIIQSYNLHTVIKSPDFGVADDIANSDYKFVMDDWNELCNSMLSVNFPENGYRDLIDINTFIDFLMVNEIVRNIEMGNSNSTFAYKDKGGKISMGPLWDFDIAFGMDWANSVHTYFRSSDISSRNVIHAFFRRFFEDPIFLAKYKERWNEKYDKVVEITDYIETLGERIRPSVLENSERWAIPSGGYRAEYDTDHARQTGYMIDWLERRISWLDTELNKVEVLPAAKNYGAVARSYPEVPPQKFTLVSYGGMTNLIVGLIKGVTSPFEVASPLTQMSAGNGGYLAAIGVKPKDSLAATSATYRDTLVLGGRNQNRNFTFRIPLSFVVSAVNINPIDTATFEPEEVFEFTPGPNPVSRFAKSIVFFYQGKRISNGTLTIYDAAGNIVRKINIRDSGAVGDRRIVGEWNLRDAKGRRVPKGSYLARGMIAAGGQREWVSFIIGVR